jgi:hypothetical protein
MQAQAGVAAQQLLMVDHTCRQVGGTVTLLEISQAQHRDRARGQRQVTVNEVLEKRC